MTRALAIIFAIAACALGAFAYVQTTELNNVRTALTEATAGRTKSDQAVEAARKEAASAEDKVKALSAKVAELEASLAKEKQARMDAETRASAPPAQPQ